VKRFRYEYGAGPMHLVAAVVGLGVSAWALVTVLGLLGRPVNFARWLAGSVVAHDLLFLPLYSAAGALVALAVLRGRPSPLRTAALNHLRVPALLSGLALLVFFPLILSKAPKTFERATGYSPDFYLGRWLVLSAVLFGLSALVFVVRLPALRSRP
jgi:hypothetical protein